MSGSFLDWERNLSGYKIIENNIKSKQHHKKIPNRDKIEKSRHKLKKNKEKIRTIDYYLQLNQTDPEIIFKTLGITKQELEYIIREWKSKNL
ncbi:MAG: hypothetical protein ACTSU2_14275 [Promethearchaeota archaeon]